MVGTTSQQKNEYSIWGCFAAINSFYSSNIALRNSKETTLLLLSCMLELIEKLNNSTPSLSMDEKECLKVAHAYWLEGSSDLEGTMISLNNKTESKITYRNPAQDNKLSCLSQVLSIDKDHLDDFPEFLENIHHVGLSIDQILFVLKGQFQHIPELQRIFNH